MIMKTQKFRTIRKFVSVLLTVAILFGMSSTLASSAEATPIKYIDASNALIKITSTGWSYNDGEENAFVGDYFLYGVDVKNITVDSGVYNITVHDLNIASPQWHSAFCVEENATVNLTALGVNEFVAYNHAGITGKGAVNLSLGENSSLLLDRSYNQSNSDYSVAEITTFSVEAGTSADSLDMTSTAWRKSELTISKGTAKAHTLSVKNDENNHWIDCNECGVTIVDASAHTFDSSTEICTVCGFGLNEGERPVCYIDASNASVTITNTGWSYDGGEENAFVGDYFLYGTDVKNITVDSGVHNITVHDLNIASPEWCSALYVNKNATVNLTALGINEFVAYNHAGITGLGTVNLSLGENSSLLLDRSYDQSNNDYSVAENVTFNLLSGTADGVDMTTNAWKKSPITFTNGTAGNHTIEIIGNALGHVNKCVTCEKLFENVIEHDYKCEEATNGHINACVYCDYTDGVIHPHEYTYYSEIDSEYCQGYCSDCGAQIGEPTLHDMSYYYYYNETYCIVTCDRCGYGDEESTLVEHDFTGEYISLSDEYCVTTCINCTYFDENYATEHVEGESVTVAPEGDTPGYTATYCENCDAEMSKIFDPNTISVTVSDIDGYAWENAGFILYIDGVPTELIRYMGFDGLSSETYGIHYDENKSYVFKYISNKSNSVYQTATISLIDSDGNEQVLFSAESMGNFSMLETVLQINAADYFAVDDAATWSLSDNLESYTPQSVKALVDEMKQIERMLPTSEQQSINAKADAITNAIGNLELNDSDETVTRGVIDINKHSVTIYNDEEKKGYYLYDAEGNLTWYDYEGDYVIIDTADKETDYESYSDNYIDVVSGKVNISLVNCYMVSEYCSPIGIWNDSDVTLNLYGANASVVSDVYMPGIFVSENAKLTIEDKGGSLIAIGYDDCAGIGSDEFENAGSITINGGTIFALSFSDGAGIGGGYQQGFKSITINGGKIWAECLSDDGAGIGVGDDGNGGDIVINGGDIIALSIDDDGAGIGGANEGSVNSITINGGKIVAGSDDAAAIGSGQDSESSIGKIIINGGEISASKWHDSSENLIGKGNSSSQDEDENNFILINGGTINTDGSNGISPAPRKKTEIPVNSACQDGVEVEVKLSNGETVSAVPENGIITLYLHEGVTVESITSDVTVYALDINFTSFGDETDTVIEIIAEGNTEPSYELSALGTNSGFEYTGTWLIDEIEAGTYVVRVSKKNHVTREYEIRVDASISSLDVQINLIGDVTGDGRVRMNDMNMINSHIKETYLLEGYELLCADVTGDGNVKMNDLNLVNAHIKEIKNIWEA